MGKTSIWNRFAPFLGKSFNKQKSSDAVGKFPKEFVDSQSYWEKRYAIGGNSGSGSYGRLATFKADVLNSFIRQNGISTVIEFGCGDGNQLTLAEYRTYRGYDVSKTAVDMCNQRFATNNDGDRDWKFFCVDEYTGEKAELALSLDVLFHLVEDEQFTKYMNMLFSAADQYVIIYSSDREDNPSGSAPHVRHRKFSSWVTDNQHGWHLNQVIRNPYQWDSTQPDDTSFCDFFVYKFG